MVASWRRHGRVGKCTKGLCCMKIARSTGHGKYLNPLTPRRYDRMSPGPAPRCQINNQINKVILILLHGII